LARSIADKQPEVTAMREAKTYRQYAADCRRMADTMSAKDREVLLQMAVAWDSRADEAERQSKRRSDGPLYAE